MIRRIVFWSHLCVGLVCGLFAFVLCVTGAILAFELQLVDRAERDERAARPSATADLAEPSALISAVRRAVPDRIQTMEWFADPAMPVRFITDKREAVLVNGYTGEVLGRGAARLRAFMRWTTSLHTNLTTGELGGTLVEWANVGFVFLIVSGLWIWWPRVWRWKALRHSVAFRWDAKGKARDWNWHNAAGFWFLLPLLFMAATGLVLSFKSVDQWWRNFGGKTLLGPPVAVVKPTAAGAEALTWAQRLRLLQAAHPGWRSIMVFGQGAPNKDGLVSLRVNYGTFRQATRNVEVKLDAKSGRIVEERSWGSQDGSPRARSIARLGHSGEFFGNWGQLIALLGCLAGLLLVYTGFALSWRRFFSKRADATA